MINDQLFGKWKEIKGEIITEWGNLKDDEMEKTRGNLISILGIIQQQYGEKKEDIELKLKSIFSKFSEKTDEVKEHLKENPV